MDIKTRIDALTEAEAKAALEWAIYKARIYGSCFECDLDGKCRKDDSVDCDMEFLRQALKEARKMTEDETMRKYAEAHGCGEACKFKIDGQDERNIYATFYCDNPERPLPCVRDEHGEIREQTVKRLMAKINEELDELKQALFIRKYFLDMDEHVAEEAADTITAITTMLEALGIDAEMRDESQRRVNDKNRERGRL